MSKKDPQRVFPAYVRNVQDKADRVENFMTENRGDNETFGTWRRETLATYITSLRNQITRMEDTWDTIRLDPMSQAVFEKVSKQIDDSMNLGLDVLDRADKFMMVKTKHVPPPVEPPQPEVPQNGGAQAQAEAGAEIEGRGGSKMDNTLRPTDKLTRNMSLEEATTWLKMFENYLKWNRGALDRKSNADVRHLLEINLDAGLISKLETDETINENSTVCGANGILSKLKQYFLNDYPLMVRRHNFTECKQAQGEMFKVWWDKRKAKAVECALETMNRDDVMMLELVRGVSDTMLQKKLLMEQQPKLSVLVRIAEQWQALDSVQTALGGESAEYV